MLAICSAIRCKAGIALSPSRRLTLTPTPYYEKLGPVPAGPNPATTGPNGSQRLPVKRINAAAIIDHLEIRGLDLADHRECRDGTVP
jgi:hypothetical protein